MFRGPFGELLVATEDGEALSRVWLPPAHPQPGWVRDDDLPVLADARRQFRRTSRGSALTSSCRSPPRGTAFQRKVWDALRRIEYGTTRSYGQIAD